ASGGTHGAEPAAGLRRLAAVEAEVRREAVAAVEAASAIDVERARLEAECNDARRRLRESGGDPAEGERDELAAKLERLERRRELLGGVNPFAQEEYEREKARLAELSVQRGDLEQSLAELEKLRRHLPDTAERRCEAAVAAV